MHDPCTVAFEIRRPWPQSTSVLKDGTKWRYYPSIITIWHVDPEKDGSDDSCGWVWPKATEADRALAKELARDEFEFWLGEYADSAAGGIPFDAHDIIFWAWARVAAKRTGKRAALSRSEMQRIHLLVANPHDNIRRTVNECASTEGMERLFLTVDRLYRHHHRPWWKHPRWHVWHWRIQFHPWQTLRRWLFTRCAHCGKRFAYGGSPISHSWHSPKPGWFKSEVGLFHDECSAIHCAVAEKQRAEEAGDLVTQ
jgi:hypothetical protein